VPPSKRHSAASVTGYQQTRSAHRQETAEDYALAISRLIEQRGEARVRDLAQVMGVSHVTVVRIVQRLSDEGLVRTEPYKPVALTAAGRRLADTARKRHELVRDFLISIGVPAKVAAIDAEGMAHHLSEATARAMRRRLKAES
jgi:DtxR family transcriptional regulator, manganese transport regulator